MDDQKQNLTKEEKADGMPEIMMEIPADEFSADEIPADEFSADEIPADEFLSDEIPAEEKEEPLNVSPESMTETLAPENKDIFSEQQTEMSGSDVKTDLHDDFEVPEASADLFEQNTMYVRTDEPEESPQTEESVPDDRNVLRNEDHSESGNAPEKAQDEHADSVTHEDTDRPADLKENSTVRQTDPEKNSTVRQEGTNRNLTGRMAEGTGTGAAGPAGRTIRTEALIRLKDGTGEMAADIRAAMTATALRILRIADRSIHRIRVFRKSQRSRLPEKRIKKENAAGSRRELQRACSQLRSSCSLVSALPS